MVEALIANNSSLSTNWVLNSDVTAPLISDLAQLHQSTAYNNSQQVLMGNGQILLISYNGQGILPTPKISSISNTSSMFPKSHKIHYLLTNSLMIIHASTSLMNLASRS